ncbi:hypothetical protein OJ997_06925 [Solirubrobacter phytolaccae]|uniref:Uncharacterized protein n=1 Tax=Solirubrobacter phytolaccae TaxID=1404360 RepID=A0A9X3N858_9ACTN|nr:hypothetical protein [Solirubrobacter phytolaccae]MDA0180022.1 hypothetical protein [Solirubrobacter phytolaccae]
MKSPEAVAAAKAEFFDDFQVRVGRFAGGADLSRRYARELHDWLVARHRGDQLADRSVALLQDYPGTVGQPEARRACTELLASVRLRVEGERLRWLDVPDDTRSEWRDAFAIESSHARVPTACPLCRRSELRRYFRRYDNDRGGGWEWCGSCLHYEHHSARIPSWWTESPILDAVPASVLEHSPEYLERAIRLAGDRDGDAAA